MKASASPTAACNSLPAASKAASAADSAIAAVGFRLRYEPVAVIERETVGTASS